MFLGQAIYVLGPLQLGVGGETEGACSAEVEIDGPTGLKFLKSGFALLLLNSVPLPGEVKLMKTQCASGKLIEHGVCVEPCLAGDFPYRKIGKDRRYAQGGAYPREPRDCRARTVLR